MRRKLFNGFISLIAAIVLIAIFVTGAFVVIRKLRSVVYYEDIILDKGSVTYLAAYYKLIYVEQLKSEGIAADDNSEFWNSTREDGQSYGDHFKASFEDYIRTMTAYAWIYSKQLGYTAENKLMVHQRADEILNQNHSGTRRGFNEKSREIGFDYNDFRNAAAFLYKAQSAQTSALDFSKFEDVKQSVKFGVRYDNIDILEIPMLTDDFIINFN